jgi:hypothetical protein
MSQITLPAGTTEYVDVVLLEDAAGDPVTGLAATDMTLHYYREGAAANQAVTIEDLSALDDAWAAGANDSDVLEIDATDNPGKYLIHLPNEAFAAGAGWVTFTLLATGAKHWQRTYFIDNSVRNFVPAAGASGGATTVNLPSGLPIHDGTLVMVIGGTGAGSSFLVKSYATPSATTLYQGLAAAIGTDSVMVAIPSPVGGDQVDVTRWLGTAPLTPGTAGLPRVEVDGQVEVSTNNDKDGYNVTSITGLTIADLEQIVTDLQNDGRLDVLFDAIKAVTDNIPDSGALTALLADIAAILTDTGTTLDGKVDAIQAKTDALPTDPADASDIAAAFAALNDLDATEIRAAVGLSAANLETILVTSGVTVASDGLDAVVPAEPTALADLGTDSIVAILGSCLAILKNKATEHKDTGLVTITREDDSTALATGSNTDDGTTFTRGRLS